MQADGVLATLARSSLKVPFMELRWHRRLRLGALLILAVLAGWPAVHHDDEGDSGAIAVSQQRSE